jgi:hypothetical protein
MFICEKTVKALRLPVQGFIIGKQFVRKVFRWLPNRKREGNCPRAVMREEKKYEI